MAIGRSFNEALQKACQSLENNKIGLDGEVGFYKSSQEVIEGLGKTTVGPHLQHQKAMDLGVPLKTIQKQTLIDRWFLMQIQNLSKLEKELRRYTLQNIPADMMINLKQNGYSDLQIANILGNTTEEEVYEYRRALGIRRTYKLVDTCSAEFESKTPYYYSTFDQENESVKSDKKRSSCWAPPQPHRAGYRIRLLLRAWHPGHQGIWLRGHHGEL